MHLARKTDADNLLGRNARVLQGRGNGLTASLPPVFGVLFRPSIMRRGKRLMLARGRADDGSFVIDYYGTGTASTDVNA